MIVKEESLIKFIPSNHNHPLDVPYYHRKDDVMIEQDTIRLLKECDAGVKMGISSIEDVLDEVNDSHFKKILIQQKQDHQQLLDELNQQLNKYHDTGKNPDPIAKSMSWMKTKMMLMVSDKDATIADLMSDGAAMGVKSLAKYLNQYQAADEKSKDIAKRLILLEELLLKQIQKYL